MLNETEPEDGDAAVGGVLVADFFFADKTDVINGIKKLMDVKAAAAIATTTSSATLAADAEAAATEETFSKIENLLMKYQEIPALLNSSMVDLCEPITSGLLHALYENSVVILDRACKLFYLFCRIRGYKNMVKFLPNGVSHLEPCLTLLRSESVKLHNRWETRYTALLWMRILSLIPFSIDSIDSSNFKGVNLTQAIQDVCFDCFFEAGPVRDIAAYCLATLLTRPDMESHYLQAFIDRGTVILEEWVAKQGDGQGHKYFELIGVLSCLCQIYKFGHRDKVLQFAERVLSAVYPIMDSETLPQQKVRKYISKLIQRVGMAYLPPRVATWRYQRGRRNLLGAGETAEVNSVDGADAEDETEVPEMLDGIFERLLTILSDSDTVVRWSAAKGVGRLTMRLPKSYADDIIAAIIGNFDDEDDDSKWHGSCLVIAELARRGLLLPSYLKPVIDAIEKAMVYDKMRGFHSTGSHVRDSACYVCWACARAYSGAVLKSYIPSLTRKMLATFLFDREVNCRRAASAAYQESVGRLGIDNFAYGLEVMAIADYFAVGNISNCYNQLAPKIASFSMEFLEILFSDLHSVRLKHWDENIRKLASQGIGQLSSINPSVAIRALDELAKQCLCNESLERHGALLAVSEILRSVFKADSQSLVIAKMSSRDPAIRSQFTPSLWEEIINIVPQMSKGRMFRGKGGDLLRNAAAYLIESLAIVGTPLTWKIRSLFIDFLIENLRQPFDHIQDASMLALRTLLYHTVVTSAIDPAKVSPLTLLKFVTGAISEQNVAATRGFALALSAMPFVLLEHNQDDFASAVTCLSTISHPGHLIAGEADPETRKNAIKSAAVILSLIIDNGGDKTVFIQTLWDLLLRSCNDYSVDKRGDTGSWCRAVALTGLESVLNSILKLYESGKPGQLIRAGSSRIAFAESALESYREKFETSSQGFDSSSHFIYESALTQLFQQALKQMGEKIDSVRDLCGNIIQTFLRDADNSVKLLLPGYDVMVSHLNECERKDRENTKGSPENVQLNWSKPQITFPFLCKLLQSGLFVAPIIAGLVSTIGGSLGSVSALAEKETVSVMRRLSESNPPLLLSIVSALSSVLTNSKDNDNLLTATLRTIDILMKNDILMPTNCDIHANIVPTVKSNLHSSKNYQLIKVCIDIIFDVIFWLEALRDELIDLSLCVLGHKYPKIRKYIAETLYMLFMNDYFVKNFSKADLDQVSDWLIVTPWEGEVAICRDVRDKICAKLNRQLPKVAGQRMQYEYSLEKTESGLGVSLNSQSDGSIVITQVNAAVLRCVSTTHPGPSAGLLVGDILVALNGQSVNKYEDVVVQLRGCTVGSVMKFKVLTAAAAASSAAGGGRKKKAKDDELDSYASLVRVAGY